MFADDTLVYNLTCSGSRTHKNPNDVCCCDLQADTDLVCCWAKATRTTFNAGKSSAMLVSRSRRTSAEDSSGPPPLLLDGTLVSHVTSVRHLGVTIHSSLHWSDHINQIIRSVGWKVSVLKRLAFRARLSLSVFSMLYKCLVRPCLEYASCVWDGCPAADSILLERLQLSLARAILSSVLGSSCVSGLSKAQLLLLVRWPTLTWRRRRQKLIYFFYVEERLWASVACC